MHLMSKAYILRTNFIVAYYNDKIKRIQPDW